MQRNRIAHYASGSSDKIYIASIRQQPNGSFVVIGKWGRRGGTVKSQIKGTYGTLEAAEIAMKNLFFEKLSEGYRDIESKNYNGVVTIASVQQDLEADSDLSAVNPIDLDDEPEEKEAVKELLAGRDGKLPLRTMRVKCINNLGIEDRFEVDVEYEATHAKDKQMLVVTDMHGKKDDYFAERFVES